MLVRLRFHLYSPIKRRDVLSSMPTNPFTGDVFSDSDASGRLIYQFVSADEYQLQLYGKNNNEIIFNYPKYDLIFFCCFFINS